MFVVVKSLSESNLYYYLCMLSVVPSLCYYT